MATGRRPEDGSSVSEVGWVKKAQEGIGLAMGTYRDFAMYFGMMAFLVAPYSFRGAWIFAIPGYAFLCLDAITILRTRRDSRRFWHATGSILFMIVSWYTLWTMLRERWPVG